LKVELTLFKITSTEYTLEMFQDSQLSDSQKKEVNQKLIDIQLNLFESGSNQLQKLINDFEKISNYETIGDLTMNLDINQEQI